MPQLHPFFKRILQLAEKHGLSVGPSAAAVMFGEYYEKANKQQDIINLLNNFHLSSYEKTYFTDYFERLNENAKAYQLCYMSFAELEKKYIAAVNGLPYQSPVSERLAGIIERARA